MFTGACKNYGKWTGSWLPVIYGYFCIAVQLRILFTAEHRVWPVAGSCFIGHFLPDALVCRFCLTHKGSAGLIRDSCTSRIMIRRILLQSTLVISNSKGPAETLRDIRTSTYQMCRIEVNTKRTTKFHK